jgi:hypothetical protein
VVETIGTYEFPCFQIAEYLCFCGSSILLLFLDYYLLHLGGNEYACTLMDEIAVGCLSILGFGLGFGLGLGLGVC